MKSDMTCARALLALLLALSLGACSSDSSTDEATDDPSAEADAGQSPEVNADAGSQTAALPKYDTSGIYYSNEKLGLTVSEFDEWGNPGGGDFKTRANGTFELFGEARVSVEDVGDRFVTTALFAEPSDVGDRITVVTYDEETDQERHFHYDPSEALLVIGDDDGGVFVFKETDGTYGVVTSLFADSPDDASVDIAENGYEAWQLLQDYNQFTETSNFSLLMAYALVNAGPRPVLTAGGSCVLPCCPQSGGSGGSETECCSEWSPLFALVPGPTQPCDQCPSLPAGICTPFAKADTAATAGPTPVCETFKELCDCIACQAAGRGDSCELCLPPQ